MGGGALAAPAHVRSGQTARWELRHKCPSPCLLMTSPGYDRFKSSVEVWLISHRQHSCAPVIGSEIFAYREPEWVRLKVPPATCGLHSLIPNGERSNYANDPSHCSGIAESDILIETRSRLHTHACINDDRLPRPVPVQRFPCNKKEQACDTTSGEAPAHRATYRLRPLGPFFRPTLEAKQEETSPDPGVHR